ncbi:MAG: asparaginase [Planctomycetes bacterium]|nr:asparaginase [Planctomycetota bacterium]
MRSAILVTTRRAGILECEFRGSYVVVRRGKAVRHRGDPARLTYFRSAAKPFQALACFEAGAPLAYGLSLAELALMAGSHTGEPMHVEAARSILRKAGLSAEALQCGVHPPLSEAAHVALLVSGGRPSLLHNNCSGKHAGMLAGCRCLGLPLETYLAPEHPYQQSVLRQIAEACGLSVRSVAVGIDGCSAPNYAVPLDRVARSYASLAAEAEMPAGEAAAGAAHAPLAAPPAASEVGAGAGAASGARPRTSRTSRTGGSTRHVRAATAAAGVDAEPAPRTEAALPGGSPLATMARAMQTHPEMVEGPHRFTTDLIRATHGRVIAKVGAEGLFCVGVVGEELGLALKFDDGSARFTPHVTLAVLERLGCLRAAEREALSRYAGLSLRNHRGITVGEVVVRV